MAALPSGAEEREVGAAASGSDGARDAAEALAAAAAVGASDAGAAEEKDDEPEVALVAKWKERSFELLVPLSATVGSLKRVLAELTDVLPKRQKLVGLLSKASLSSAGDDSAVDGLLLRDIGVKPRQRFMMVGNPEHELFVDLAEGSEPEVLNDLDVDYQPDDHDVERDADNRAKLDATEPKLKINLLHAPRPGKRLLVLDLDYTLFDMKSRAENFEQLKRPHTDTFLAAMYPHFDIVVWSQTAWSWLEIKLTELGLLTHTQYHIMFVLDKSCMFTVESRSKEGATRSHQVKALELIWRKFPQYTPDNTVHVDDLGRNAAMNPQSLVKVKAYRHAHVNRSRDRELAYLASYLLGLVQSGRSFRSFDHTNWKDTVKAQLRGARH